MGLTPAAARSTRVDSSQITMSSTFGPNATLYYTLDGSDPDYTAIPYSGPFTLTNSATLRAIAYNPAYTGSAEAAPIYLQVLPTYPLSVSTTGGGSVSISPAPYAGGGLYLGNTIVTLTATPSNGWLFVGWTGDITATTNVTTLVMDQPHAVQAVFQIMADVHAFCRHTGRRQRHCFPGSLHRREPLPEQHRCHPHGHALQRLVIRRMDR